MTATRRMARREAIKWMLAASASVSLLRGKSFGATSAVAGYGTDPKLMEVYKPGDLWPLTLTPEQHRLVAALCNFILPPFTPRDSHLPIRQHRRHEQNLVITAYRDSLNA